jgi:hypothetical protein
VDDNDQDVSMMTTTSTTTGRRIRMITGSLSSHPAHALNHRQSFLFGRPSYLLYFLDVIDAHQLLQSSSLQRLTRSNAGAADASSAAPSAMIASAGSRSGATGDHAFEPLPASLNRIAEIQENMV